MNLFILLAIGLQFLIAKRSRIASAVVGFIITTGIFLWGLGVYAGGDKMSFGAIALSAPIFIILCILWFAFDAKELLVAVRGTKLAKQFVEGPLQSDEKIAGFFRTTQNAWSSGALAGLGANFAKEASKPFEKFAVGYCPYENSALDVFFKQYSPYADEYLVGAGDLGTDSLPAWFVLTSHRLIQREGIQNEFTEILLSDVDSYFVEKAKPANRLVFTMKSGESIVLENVKLYPSDKFLSVSMQRQPLIA